MHVKWHVPPNYKPVSIVINATCVCIENFILPLIFSMWKNCLCFVYQMDFQCFYLCVYLMYICLMILTTFSSLNFQKNYQRIAYLRSSRFLMWDWQEEQISLYSLSWWFLLQIYYIPRISCLQTTELNKQAAITIALSNTCQTLG